MKTTVLSKMMLRSAIVLTVSILLVELIAYYRSSDQIIRLTEEQQHHLTELYAERFDQTIAAIEVDLNTIATLPSLTDYRRNRQYGLLEEARRQLRNVANFASQLYRRNPAYVSITLEDLEGREEMSVLKGEPSIPPVTELPLPPRERTETRNDLRSEIAVRDETQETALVFVYPLVENNIANGRIVIRFDLVNLLSGLSKERLFETGRFSVFTFDGHVVQHPILRPLSRLQDQRPALNTALTSMRPPGTMTFENAEGRQFLLGTAAMTKQPWLIASVVPEDEMLAELNATRDLIILLVVVAIALEFLAVFIFTKHLISDPVKKLLMGTRAVEEGDYLASVDIRSRDEMGELGASFNHMTASLNRFIQQRQQAEESLRERTEVAELLENIAAAANEASDIRDAMQAFIDLVCAFTDWPVGHVYMIDQVKGGMYSTDIWHLRNPQHFETFRRVTMETRLASGIGLPGRVLANRKPAWIEDVTKDDNFPRADLAKDLGVKAGFAFPVIAGNEVVAVLEFFAEDAVRIKSTLPEVTAQIGTHLGRVIERNQARREILKAKEDAEKANLAKSEFLANMSHELRTPLNAVLGFADILSHQYFGPPGAGKYQEYARDILVSGEHLLELVDDLLDLSTIEVGKKAFNKEPLSVEDIIAECSNIIDGKAAPKDIELVAKAAKDLPILYADRRAVKQILINILSNAVKFSPDGGRIILDATASNGQHIFKISDTGEGAPEDMLPSLTDPFVSAGTNPYTTGEGTGLGLAIVKSLVELHDGELDIKSKLGEGMTVKVTLPSGLA